MNHSETTCRVKTRKQEIKMEECWVEENIANIGAASLPRFLQDGQGWRKVLWNFGANLLRMKFWSSDLLGRSWG